MMAEQVTSAPRKIKMSDIRAQFPMYGQLSDEQLLIALRRKHYPDVPMPQFVGVIDFDTAREKYDPSEGGGTLQIGPFDTGIRTPEAVDRALAGAGKTFADLGRSTKRVGSALGIGDYSQADAAEDARLDKPLMDTTAGKVGKFAGDVAVTALPGMGMGAKLAGATTRAGSVLPQAVGAVTRGAAPYVGAAGSGAALGAALSPEDMSGGATIGAIGGLGGELVGRGLTAAYGGAKALLEPLYEKGRERILKRTLERFAKDPQAVARAAANPEVLVPGYSPTLAEATLDPGIAQLQRAAQTSPEVASALAEANAQRLQAYRGVLDDLAGNDGKREFFDAAREAAAQEQYGRAFAGGLNPSPEARQVFAELMERPSVKAALPKAVALAKEKGMNISDPQGSVAGLHYVKRALDDQIGTMQRAGASTEASAVRDTQEQLLGAMRDASPAYGEALETYAAMSRPLNQMAIGQKLRDTLVPPLADFNESVARQRADSFAKALRQGDDTARAATGLRSATLEGTLEPGQLASVRGIAQDMARNTAARELAMIPGSQTAQYLGARNVLRGFLGPLGLPESALDTAAGRVATGLMGLPFKMTQSQTEELLATALRNPQEAARLLQVADNPTALQRFLQPYAAQIGIQLSTD